MVIWSISWENKYLDSIRPVITLIIKNCEKIIFCLDDTSNLFLGLWAVINNAGIAGRRFGPCEWLTLQDYKDMLAVNLLGVVDVSMTFLPLIKQERGRLVNVASVHGRTSLIGNAPYSCSKYAVEAFYDNLR